MKKSQIFILLFLIVAIGAFFRLWQLDSIPPGLYPDEALNANQGLEAWQTKDFKLFYPDNNGREGLYVNIIALFFAALGISLFSFKLVGILFGTLTIAGQFLFTKEVGRFLSLPSKAATGAALLSSFFLAISFWHINFSRIGFRAILLPFVLVFTSYFLLQGLRTKRIRDFATAGLFFGLGIHTYISFRLAVIPVGFLLGWWLLVAISERWGKKYVISAIK